MKKCDFRSTSITFLAFIVGQEQPSPAPAKVNRVADWPALSSWKLVQWFLGFGNVYQQFVIIGFSPLTKQTSTLKIFQWSHETDAMFSHLKALFSFAPIQPQSDPSRQFLLEVGALDVGVGAVLSQQDLGN